MEANTTTAPATKFVVETPHGYVTGMSTNGIYTYGLTTNRNLVNVYASADDAQDVADMLGYTKHDSLVVGYPTISALLADDDRTEVGR